MPIMQSPLLQFREQARSEALANGFRGPFRFRMNNALDPVLGVEACHDGTLIRFNQTLLECPELWSAALRSVISHDMQTWEQVLSTLEKKHSFGAQPIEPAKLEEHGAYHDLQLLFSSLNHRYFENAIVSTIGWGKRRGKATRRAKRRSIRLGSYWPKDRHIRIHPALNRLYVPEIVVQRVIHHEMAHACLHQRNPEIALGHGPEFRRIEEMFVEANNADAWVEQNLQRLLG